MSVKDQSGSKMNRRAFLKAGATVGTIGLVGSKSGIELVGDADAFACGGLCIATAATAGGIAVGWTLRETEVIGKDDPPEGLTDSALLNEIQNTAENRKSNNKSTFIDNKNIIKYAKNSLYSQAKLNAIESLNNQKTESEVLASANSAIDKEASIIKSNFLKSWNETVLQVDSFISSVESHPDLGTFDIINQNDIISWEVNPANVQFNSLNNFGAVSSSYTLPDGSSITLQKWESEINIEATQTTNNYAVGAVKDLGSRFSPAEKTEHINGNYTFYTNNLNNWGIDINGPSKTIRLIDYESWKNVWNEIDSTIQTVRDNIGTWVTNVYGQVQSGELDTNDLITPSELAQLSDNEQNTLNQATADLIALNLPVDLKRKVTVELTQSSGSSELKGYLATTESTTINSGDTIDPTTNSIDYYLTYNIKESSGSWEAYQTGVDGGIATFTEQPYEGVKYTISTAAGETATVGADAFSINNNDNYEVDISPQVETAITDIDTVTYEPKEGENTPTYETIQLDEAFTVTKIIDETDNNTEVDSTSYEKPAEAETDNNYITKEEWKQRQQNYEDLIEKFKEAKSGGSGVVDGIGGFLGNIGNIGTYILYGGAALLGISALNALTSN